jgi:hypothetical protein
VGRLVFDVVLFVVFCILTIVQFATRRGGRMWGVVLLSLAVMMLGAVLGDPPFDRLFPFGISVGLVALGFLTFLLVSFVRPIIRRRQPQ